MEIVLAAEKSTIAGLLSDRLHCPVDAQELSVRPNPEETGSFLVRWRLNRYLLSPDGRLALRAVRTERVGGDVPVGGESGRTITSGSYPRP